MKSLLSLVAVSSLTSIGVAQLLGAPIFNPLDPRFNEWQAPGPNDSRGPCPALNSLANHGFVPRSGKNVTVIDLIRGGYEGFSVSPEVMLLVGIMELIKSYRLTTFDLEELSNHGFIDHDCSLSRADIGDGNNNDFNATVWSVPLKVLMNYETITPQAIGAARTARDLFDIAHNPNQECGVRSIAFGAIENGLLLNSLGGNPKLEWVRSIFEDQRIPTHLGFNPGGLLTNNVLTTVATGLESLVSQPNLTELIAPAVISSPADLVAEVLPIKDYNLTYTLEVLGLAGFPSVDLGLLTL